MAGQNARAVKYLKVQTFHNASGKVAEINQQIQQDMGLAGPFSLSTPSERVHAVRWGLSRESYVVSTYVSRREKEIVASAVSQLNSCAYCAEAHTATIRSGGEAALAQAIRDGSWKDLKEGRTRSLIEWGLANRHPEASIITNPPFSAKEAPEILGTALEFHTTNRLADIFLEDSPLPDVLQKRWIKGIALKVASKTIFKEMVRKQAVPGKALRFIEEVETTGYADWANPLPAYAKALAAQEVLVKKLEKEHIPSASAGLFQEELSKWRGEEMPLGRKWLESLISSLPEEEKPLARLFFLTAFASYTVSEKDISSFRNLMPGDQQLLEVCYWAAAKTSQRIASWLEAPFKPAQQTKVPKEDQAENKASLLQ